jgi:hypothetical protein
MTQRGVGKAATIHIPRSFTKSHAIAAIPLADVADPTTAIIVVEIYTHALSSRSGTPAAMTCPCAPLSHYGFQHPYHYVIPFSSTGSKIHLAMAVAVVVVASPIAS